MDEHINSQFQRWRMVERIHKEYLIMPKENVKNINIKIQALEEMWSEIENYHFMLFETYDEEELNRTEYVYKSIFLKWEDEYTKAYLAMLRSIRELKEENGNIIHKYPLPVNKPVELKSPEIKKSNDSIPEIDSNRRSRVNAYLQRIMAMKNCNNESASSMKYLLDTMTGCLRDLNGAGVDTSSWDAIIVYIVVNKLDSSSLKKWEELLRSVNNDSLPTLTMFIEFLEDRLRTLEDLVDIKSKENERTKKPVNSIDSKEEEGKERTSDVNIVEKSVHYTHTRKEIFCTYCDSEHRIYNCQRFKSLSYEEKRSFIGKKKLCLNCLAPHHRAKQCKHYIRCKFCGGKHNSFIHIPSRNNKGKTSPKVCRREEAFRKIQSTNEDEVLKHFVKMKKIERNSEHNRKIFKQNMRNVNSISTKNKEKMYINRELGKNVHRSRKKEENVHSLKKYNTKEINEKKMYFLTHRVPEKRNNREGSQRLDKEKLVYSRSQLKFLNNIHT